MGKPRCALVILGHREFSGEVGCLASVGYKVQASWMQITAAETVTKMGGNFGPNCGGLGMSRWDCAPIGGVVLAILLIRSRLLENPIPSLLCSP